MNIASLGGSSMLQQMQQAMFSKLDVNSDGQLSSDEFSSIGQNMPGPGKSGSATSMRGGGFGGANFSSETLGSLLSVQESDASRDARSAEIFSGADADGEGSLTAEELAADMAAHAPPGASGSADTSSMASDLISNADSDGDGALSLDEFKAAAPSGPPPGGPPPGGPPPSGSADSEDSSSSTTSSSTNALDTNGDGKVSMSELLTSLQSVDESSDGFSAEVSDLLSQLLEKLTSATGTSSTTTVAEAA